MTKRITNEELSGIRERVEKATEGPWDEYVRQFGCDGEDAAFIANARGDIPKLLTEIERLEKQYDELTIIAHDIEKDRNMTWMEYREYYEESEADKEALKALLNKAYQYGISSETHQIDADIREIYEYLYGGDAE